MSKVQSIIEEIKGLSLLEASELVKGLEEALGVSAAAARQQLLPKRRPSSTLFSPR